MPANPRGSRWLFNYNSGAWEETVLEWVCPGYTDPGYISWVCVTRVCVTRADSFKDSLPWLHRPWLHKLAPLPGRLSELGHCQTCQVYTCIPSSQSTSRRSCILSHLVFPNQAMYFVIKNLPAQHAVTDFQEFLRVFTIPSLFSLPFHCSPKVNKER